MAAEITDGDRVCERCMDRLTGRKPFVPQPPARRPKPLVAPPASTPEPKKVAFEVPRRIAKLLDGVLDPVGARPTSRGEAVRYELPVAEAQVVADVLREIGERRESARILRATETATAS
jgi:hypothetical protein